MEPKELRQEGVGVGGVVRLRGGGSGEVERKRRGGEVEGEGIHCRMLRPLEMVVPIHLCSFLV